MQVTLVNPGDRDQAVGDAIAYAGTVTLAELNDGQDALELLAAGVAIVPATVTIEMINETVPVIDIDE